MRPALVSAALAAASPEPSIANHDRANVKHGKQRAETRAKGLPWPIKLFLIGLFVPLILSLGPLKLSIYRIVLLIVMLPCVVMWMRGKAGTIRFADIGIILFCSWAALTLIVAHGFGPAIEPSGILFIEGMAAYLLARCYIRSAEDFSNMVGFTVKLIICVLPFAVYEFITGEKPLLEGLGQFLPTVKPGDPFPRMGFWRVQGPFDHPILFGVVCGSMVAFTGLVSSSKSSVRVFLACIVAGTAFLSLSSAPIAGLAFQIALLSWNGALRALSSRWKLLWGLVIIGYLIVELGSNQTPIEFYISHFTLEQETGWYRIWIWQYGSASVMSHPVFGIGLHEWVRAHWMLMPTVDNFWLLMTMRHGLPALVLMVTSFLAIWIAVARKSDLDPRLQTYRTAYLICMAFFVFVGSTVHFWTATYAWFFFLVGSGVWLLDAKSTQSTEQVSSADRIPAARLRAAPKRRVSRSTDDAVTSHT